VAGELLGGKLLGSGPITTNREIRAVVESPMWLHGDRPACICVFCCTSHIQTPTNPDLQREECK
jgi:hypothetical protein